MGDDDETDVDDALGDVDDEVMEDAEEFLFGSFDEDYQGCYCKCTESDVNYAPDTVKMFGAGELDGTEPLCVSDLDSVVYNSQGTAVCDEQCLLEELGEEEIDETSDSEEDNR